MAYIYVMMSDTGSYADAFDLICGVFTSKKLATKAKQELIDSGEYCSETDDYEDDRPSLRITKMITTAIYE